LSIFEDGVSPEFRIQFENWIPVSSQDSLMIPSAKSLSVTTIRSNGQSQVFAFKPSNDGKYLRSTQAIPEPHEFHVELRYEGDSNTMELYSVDFREHDHHDNPEEGKEESHRNTTGGIALMDFTKSFSNKTPSQKKPKTKKKYEQDNNFRAALLHVVADGLVSMVTIASIAIAGTVEGAWFLNPLAGIIGSLVIISWGIQLIYDTAGSLLDISPDPKLNEKIKKIMESDGATRIVDLHVWKLGPGKLGVIVSLATTEEGRGRTYYYNKLKKYKVLAHITIEIYDLSSLNPSSRKSGLAANPLHDLEIDDHNHSHGHGHDHSH
jgi:hypothetical protein